MKYIKQIMIIIALGLFGIGIAAEADGVGFNVKSVESEKQKDKTKTYYDISLKSGEETILKTEITNVTDKDIQVLVKPTTAYTNNYGNIEYNKGLSVEEFDPSMTIGFGEIAKTAEEINVPAKSTKIIETTVTMPVTDMKGIVLGGLYFEEKETEESKNQSAQVKNKISYNLAVVVHVTEEVEAPKLELKEVHAGQVNYRNMVEAIITNPTSAMILNLTIEGEVTKKGSNKVLYKELKEGQEFAPNSSYNYEIRLPDNKKFEAGDYVFKGKAKSSKEEWVFEKEFKITDKEAKENNDKAVNLEKVSTVNWWLIGGLIVLGGLLIILIITLIVRRKKKANIKKNHKKKTQSKNNKQTKRKRRN